MQITKKKLYLTFFVFLLILFFGSFSAFTKTKNPRQLVLLWNTSFSMEEASEYLSKYDKELFVLEHNATTNYSLCQTSSHKSFDVLLSELNNDPAILLAEENYELELCSISYPDDPFIDASWAFENKGVFTHYYGIFPVEQTSTEGIDMNIWEAWEAYPISKEETKTVIVAIIDTGVDYQHPDLQEQMWINPNEIPDNGFDDDGNGYIDDIHGWDFFHNDASICDYIKTKRGYSANPDDNDNHGTHIAGIIGATANNNIGIAGVASNVNVQIMSLKIHGGTSSSGSVANAIKAIHYAEAMGADICNLSWGTTTYSQALELTIRESSMLFVTAAGNTGQNNNSTPVFPANLRLPNLISVGFIDYNGLLDAESNYGVSTVDIAAPGKDIYSTLVGGSYGYLSGSSMATPYITGLAAMIYAYQDHIYPAQVKEQIINTMTPLDSLNGYLINAGIPNAKEAITSMSLLEPDTTQPFLDLKTSYDKSSIVVHISAYDSGGSGIRKIRYTYGSKSIDAFLDTNDTLAVLSDTIKLTKHGYYTFYVEDYAGNHNIYYYYVEDDSSAPKINTSYTTAPDYSSITVHLKVTDSDSGVKTIKYLEGECDTKLVMVDGHNLTTLKKEHTITISPEITALTIYVADYRGNTHTYVIYPKIIPATSLHINLSTRTLTNGDIFQLCPIVFPWTSTDGVIYRSLDSSIVTVTEDGLVTAVGSGETMVEVTTYSGISAYCRFIVPEVNTTTQDNILTPKPVNPTPSF